MPDQPRSLDEIYSQVRWHVESLRGAGVEWLPNAPATPVLNDLLPAAATDAVEGDDMARTKSLVQRRKALEVLAKKVSTCPRCAELVATRTQTVFGVGPAGAEPCFIG